MSRTNRCKYEIIGEIMTSDEKEADEKLYRVVRKKGSHVNTKVNPDGTKSALQFTDENNDLNGPLDIIEVDMSEYIRAEELQSDSVDGMRPRTWKQIVVEDIVVPIAREAIEQFLNIGFQHLEIWMEKKLFRRLDKKQRRLERWSASWRRLRKVKITLGIRIMVFFEIRYTY